MAAPADQVPGAEFLLRRLARSEAIPAAERTPDVAAFVESVQLLREASDLLPLAANGQAALSLDSPAVRQQVLLAFLKAARARYICPWHPVCERRYGTQMLAYCTAWRSPALPSGRNPADTRSRYSADEQAATLESTMHLIATSWQSSAAEAANISSNTASFLAGGEIRQKVSRALQHLAAATGQDQLLLSVEQLRYLCCYETAQAADALQIRLMLQREVASLGIAVPADYIVEVPPPAQLAAVLEAGQTCAAHLLQLEPHNHKSYLAAASTASRCGQFARAARLSLQAHQLARQQRNDWALVKSVHSAVLWAGEAVRLAPTSIQRSTREAVAAAAAHPEVEQALARCRRLLPRPWVDELDPKYRKSPSPSAPALRGQRQPASDALLADMQQQVEALAQHADCSGCKQASVGLRLCSRCKKAQYCSTACQRTHWNVHKRECQPTSATAAPEPS